MLILAHSLRELRFGELMSVYAGSNREKAEDWPDLPPMFALQQAEEEHRAYLQEVFFQTPGAVLALWEEAGKYVSALRLEPYRDGMLLAGLETAPAYRNRGFACALIRALQAETGFTRIYSHVGKRNKPSMKTHEACGFRMISDRAVYISGNVDSRCWTLLYEA